MTPLLRRLYTPKRYTPDFHGGDWPIFFVLACHDDVELSARMSYRPTWDDCGEEFTVAFWAGWQFTGWRTMRITPDLRYAQPFDYTRAYVA
jgi:hypothetical protein